VVIVCAAAWPAGLFQAAPDYTEAFPIRRTPANLTFEAAWSPKQGLKFQIEERDTDRQARVRLDKGECRVVVSPVSAGWDKSGRTFSVAREALPSVDRDPVAVTLKFRPGFWAVYMGRRLAVRFPAPFEFAGSFRRPAQQVPTHGDTLPFVQPVKAFAFHDDFMVPEEETSTLSAWQKQSGSWRIHRAYDATARRGGPQTFSAHSPNFYSLKGQGKHAVITAGHDFYDTYDFRAAVRTMPGEMGLIFCHDGRGEFYALTMEVDREAQTHPVVRLWQATGGEVDRHRVLGAVAVEIPGTQWILLRVRLFPGRIQCYVDNTLVLDVNEEMPVGGRFGLYVNSHQEVLLDDVQVQSNEDLDLATPEKVRFFALDQDGEFFREQGRSLMPGKSRNPQWLIVGSRRHGPHVFSAEFGALPSAYTIGLLAGVRGAGDAVYRFIAEKQGQEERFRLEKVTTQAVDVVEECLLRGGAGPVTLMSDATNEGQLRLYRNGRLVLVHHPETEISGASGVYVGPGTTGSIDNLRYAFQRSGLHRSQFEKNRIFTDDPYMRHWSSPEGGWSFPLRFA